MGVWAHRVATIYGQPRHGPFHRFSEEISAERTLLQVSDAGVCASLLSNAAVSELADARMAVWCVLTLLQGSILTVDPTQLSARTGHSIVLGISSDEAGCSKVGGGESGGSKGDEAGCSKLGGGESGGSKGGAVVPSGGETGETGAVVPSGGDAGGGEGVGGEGVGGEGGEGEGGDGQGNTDSDLIYIMRGLPRAWRAITLGT